MGTFSLYACVADLSYGTSACLQLDAYVIGSQRVPFYIAVQDENTVFGADHAGVPNATLQISSAAQNLVINTQTDPSGFLTIDLYPDSYTISAQALGHQAQQVVVVVTGSPVRGASTGARVEREGVRVG